MSEHFNELPGRDIDYLVRLASENLRAGRIEEPRVYFDSLTLQADSVETSSAPGVFVNGEQFPVVITHLTAALRPFDSVTTQNVYEERQIQRCGLRLTFHDSYYQAREYVPVPLWANKVVGAGDLVSQGVSSWVFDRPFVLSARDSMRVRVALESAPAAPRLVTVSFTGTGMLSRRPYFLSSQTFLSDTTPRQLITDGFRNDGAEPIAITDMSVHCGPEEEAQSGAGDITQLRVQVRQVGNGTQADWFQGPTVPSLLNECPATLVGVETGRAVVHRFPGQGLLWEPGEGITLDAVSLASSVVGLQLGVALCGYILVV
jgi:hypothetical protein